MTDSRPAGKPRGRIAPTVVALAPWAVTAAVAAAWLAARQGAPRPLPPQILPPREEPGLSEPVDDPLALDAAEPGRGRLAQWPHQIPWLGWRDILWRTYREITHDRLNAVAGSVTFFSLLAIFPALGVFVSLYGLVADVRAVEDQLAQLSLIFPADVVRIVGEQMLRLATERGANLSAAFVVSLLLSIWTANAGMKALFDGLNIAYDELEKRNYFYRTALTYGFTFAFLLFLTLISGILVAAPIALSTAGLRTDWLIGARWVALFVVATGAFTFAYRYGPCRRRARLRWLIPGAVAAALVWLGGSAGFSWFVNGVVRLQATYGSLAAVIGFMLWVYFSVLVVLMGAEFSAEVEHQTACDSTVGPEKPLGERGAAMADTVGLHFIGVRKGVSLLWAISRRMTGNLLRRPGRDPLVPGPAVTPAPPPAPPAAPPGPRRSAGR